MLRGFSIGTFQIRMCTARSALMPAALAMYSATSPITMRIQRERCACSEAVATCDAM